MGSIWHSITLDMYTIPKQFSHTPTSMNSFIANKAKKSISKLYCHISRKCSVTIQISYAITRHLNIWNLADPHLTIDNYLNIKAEAHSFKLKHTVNSCILPPDSSPVTTIRQFCMLLVCMITVMVNYGIRNGPKNTNMSIYRNGLR